MKALIKVLFVADSAEKIAVLTSELREGGLSAKCSGAGTMDALTAALDRSDWDAIVADHATPGMSWMAVLRLVRERGDNAPVIFVSDQVKAEAAVGMLKAGARDFLSKDRPGRLALAIERELGVSDIRREYRRIATALRTIEAKQDSPDPVPVGALDEIIRELTDRKWAEESLRVSEERLRQAVRVAGLGIFDHDHLADTIQWSGEMRSMMGFGADEVVGLPEWIAYIHPEDRAGIAEAIQRAHDPAGGGVYSVEHRVVRHDGSIRWISIRSRTFFEGEADARRPVRTIGAVLDITGRRQADETLQQSMEELAALNALSRKISASLSLKEVTAAAIEGMSTAICPSLTFLFLRDGERLILKEVLPHQARQLVAAMPELQVGECMCGLAVREGKPLYSMDIFKDERCTSEECRKAGMKSFVALPLNDGENIFGVIGLASDTERDFARQAGFLETLAAQVSTAFVNARLFETAQRELADRKRAEEALRAREEQLAMLVKHAPAGIAMLDMDMHYLAVSDRFLADYRLGRRDLVGLHHYDVFPEIRQMEDWQAIHRRCLAGASERREEDPFLRADGRLDWVKWEIVPWRKPDNSIGGIVMFTEVITDRKRADEELKALNVTLEQRVAERTALAEHRAKQLRQLASKLNQAEQKERRRIGIMLHEHFQQMLVGAACQLSTLRTRVGTPECRDIVDRVDQILSDTVEASRSLAVELSPPVLYELGLAPALVWLAHRFEKLHGLHVEVTADPTGEPASEETKTLLYESASELLFNVVKHAGVKTATLRMARTAAGETEIEVSDEGIGFDPAALKDIAAITGIGFFGIQEKMSLLGGSLQVSSAPGRGTTTTIRLPIAAVNGH